MGGRPLAGKLLMARPYHVFPAEQLAGKLLMARPYHVFPAERSSSPPTRAACVAPVLCPTSETGVMRCLQSQLCELIARKNGMQAVLLTVFTANIAAVKFYESLRYAPDETSPCMQQDDDDSSCYEIYSKVVTPSAGKEFMVSELNTKVVAVVDQVAAAPAFELQAGCTGEDLD